MLGNLSISTENGRGMKTYGVAGFITSNMKIVFLCIIISVTCSVGATEDTESYPDIRFGLPLPDQKPLEESIEDPRPYNFLTPLLNQDAPWRDDPLATTNQNRKLSRLSEKISESLRDIIQLIKEKRRRIPSHVNYPRYDSEENKADYYDEEFRRKITQYPYRISHQRILDDYPPDDFTFNGEHETQPNEDHEQPKAEEDLSDYRNVAPAESSGKGPIEDIVVDKSAEFAYSPFDPRYHDDFSSPTARKSTAAPPLIQSNEAEVPILDNINPISVGQRNEDNFYAQQDKIEQRQVDDSVQMVAVQPNSPEGDAAGVLIIAFVAGISAAATVGLIAFGIGWYNLQKHVKNASDVEYPAYGITGPNKDVSPSGDRRLAQSAQMYHYQHQKQQIIAMESRSAAGDRHGSVSEADSEEENEEGDYTVYECPGLAPTGEMEVKNPLFQDDPTPAQTPASKAGNGANNQKK